MTREYPIYFSEIPNAKKPPLREDFSAIVDINAGATGRIYS
jgi:hypothetical protein